MNKRSQSVKAQEKNERAFIVKQKNTPLTRYLIKDAQIC